VDRPCCRHSCVEHIGRGTNAAAVSATWRFAGAAASGPRAGTHTAGTHTAGTRSVGTRSVGTEARSAGYGDAHGATGFRCNRS
jgi:hypothetical protein